MAKVYTNRPGLDKTWNAALLDSEYDNTVPATVAAATAATTATATAATVAMAATATTAALAATAATAATVAAMASAAAYGTPPPTPANYPKVISMEVHQAALSSVDECKCLPAYTDVAVAAQLESIEDPASVSNEDHEEPKSNEESKHFEWENELTNEEVAETDDGEVHARLLGEEVHLVPALLDGGSSETYEHEYHTSGDAVDVLVDGATEQHLTSHRSVQKAVEAFDSAVDHAAANKESPEIASQSIVPVSQKPANTTSRSCWSFFSNLVKPRSPSWGRRSLEVPIGQHTCAADSDLERALLQSLTMDEAKEASMTTARDRLRIVMDKFQAKVRPVEADGNCQFRALSCQLYGDDSQHGKVRAQVVDWLTCMRQRYSDFVHEPYDDYLKRMASSGQWGDNVTLQAACDVFRREIHILNDQPGAEHVCIHPALDGEGVTEEPLWLAFLAEVHYDAVEFVV